MKFTSLFTFFVLIIILPLSAIAQPADDSGTDFINRILQETNVERTLDQAPRDLETQFSQNPLGLPAEKNKKMIELFAEAFLKDSLSRDVKQTFRASMQQGYAPKINEWLDRETTRMVHQAEEESTTLQGARKQVVRMYELEQDPPGENRQEIIESLMDATSAVSSTIESQTILFRSIISAFSILSDQRTFSETQIDGIVDNYRRQIETEMDNEIFNQFLIVYYDIDNEALQEFTSFYETEAGNWLQTTTKEGIHSAYQKAADRFVESVRNTR